MKKAYLVLSDGSVFEGIRFGAERDTVGELVFTTGMSGYIETLTDPSYYGQIIMQTFPLIGNYGIIEEDFEGKCAASGYIVREWCDTPSNFRSQYDLDQFLRDNDIPGLYGVDTREITRIIRENGVMNAMITGAVPQDLGSLKDWKIENAVKSVSSMKTEHFPAKGEERFKVTLIDYGA
jgi:carbamoyl-phosphate synthase small subunit